MPQNKPTVGGFPTRTREQLLAANANLAEEPSCAPPPSVSGNRAVLGCQAWPNCRFGNPLYGTFKGNGPELIAWFYQTIEGNEATGQHICWNFVNTMQAAMDEGIAAAMRNERHETVKIIAHTGETYHTFVRTRSVDPKTREVSWSEPKLVVKTVGPVADPYESQSLAEYRGALSAEYLANQSQPPKPLVAVDTSATTAGPVKSR
jgi:hypothetical protein